MEPDGKDAGHQTQGEPSSYSEEKIYTKAEAEGLCEMVRASLAKVAEIKTKYPPQVFDSFASPASPDAQRMVDESGVMQVHGIVHRNSGRTLSREDWEMCCRMVAAALRAKAGS